MEQLPSPVFWPGEFHRLYSPWGHKELDMNERPNTAQHDVSKIRSQGWESESCSVKSDSLQPNRLQPTRLLCPWGFSRQKYWSGLHFIFQGILNPGLPHCGRILYHLGHHGCPLIHLARYIITMHLVCCLLPF